MYVLITDFTWLDSEDEVYLTVPLKNTPSKNCDVLISSKYVKIVFKPYMFECVLWGCIDVENSKIVLESSVEAHLTLKKKIPVKWPELISDQMKDKTALLKIRQEAIEEIQKRGKEREKKNREEKRLGDKASLKAMMKIEEDERNRYEDIKKVATYTAMQELVALQKEKEKQIEERNAQIAAARAYVREIYGNKGALSLPSASATTSKFQIFKSDEKIHIPVRNVDKISISFTPRVFPTPERESMKEDEEEWLRKQAEQRRVLTSKVAENGDLSEAERDPIWLQKKAASLFKAGDHSAAAFAYTEALKRAPKNPTSACYLQTRNFFRALEDASAALDFLKPPVPQNLNSRVKAHLRRGVAFCNLEMLKEGLSEYEAAAKLNPNDESIQQDIKRLKDTLNKFPKRGIEM